MHFIPTYRSWPNQVERYFSLIINKAIRRSSLTGVKQLVLRIDYFVITHYENCQPFKWPASADSILETLHRLVHVSAGQALARPGHGDRVKPSCSARTQ
jgi:putative transposase